LNDGTITLIFGSGFIECLHLGGKLTGRHFFGTYTRFEHIRDSKNG